MKSVIISLIALIISNRLLCQNNNWQAIGSITNGTIETLWYDSIENTLYAGGFFFVLNNDTIWHIAKWNGVQWSSIGEGIDSFPDTPYTYPNIRTICRFQNRIYVGGSFSKAGSIWIDYLNIATWDGITWDTVSHRFNSGVIDIKVFNDTLYVCGGFDSVGNIQVNGIVAFDGIDWFSLGLPNQNPDPDESNFVVSMQFYQNDLYLTGYFYDSTGHQHQMMRRHNGVWEFMEDDLEGGSDFSSAMAIYDDKLIVSGYFLQQWGNADNCIMAWDGEQWHPMGGGTGDDPTINDIFVKDNKLYAVGSFKTAGDIPANRVAVWDGQQWCGFGGVFNGQVHSGAFFQDSLYIAGAFTKIDYDSVYYIAKYTGGETVDTCSTPAGISEISKDNFKLTVYPNPATARVSIALDYPEGSEIKITITDILGRIIKRWNGSINTTPIYFDLTDVANGVYHISVNGEHFIGSSKLVIQ